MKSLATGDRLEHPIDGGSLEVALVLPVIKHACGLKETIGSVAISRHVPVVRQFNRHWKQTVSFARDLTRHMIDPKLGNRRLIRVDVGLAQFSKPELQGPGLINQFPPNRGLLAAPIRVSPAVDLDIGGVVFKFQDSR